jgi:glycosyltransferase involved in cell wall biosynthesis
VALRSAALPFSRLRGRPATRGVGIVANEFFDASLGRMGGFGWAARASAEHVAEARPAGHRPFLLAGKGGLGRNRPERHESGIPLVRFDDDRRRYARRLARARLGLFLTIDYRPNYLPVLASRPVPVIVWARDPRTPADVERIATLELPSAAEAPDGVDAVDCRSLARLVERASAVGSRVVFASPAPGLATPRMRATYGVEPDDVRFLPNPVAPVAVPAPEAGRPRVVFLGRLDPIKRPWVFVHLARRFPAVDFVMLGRPHFSGPGAWRPARLPENVSVLGHVDGDVKHALLGSAWLVVNTSIHESLPVSFLEALHAGTPIVSCQDPEGVTSRFGTYVGRHDGDGLEALDPFSDALEHLLGDDDLRRGLGAAGRDWARATHTPERFLDAFAALAGSLDR